MNSSGIRKVAYSLLMQPLYELSVHVSDSGWHHQHTLAVQTNHNLCIYSNSGLGTFKSKLDSGKSPSVSVRRTKLLPPDSAVFQQNNLMTPSATHKSGAPAGSREPTSHCAVCFSLLLVTYKVKRYF